MHDMKKSGKRPEQETWDLLIEACVVCGRWECAVEILVDMIADEVRTPASRTMTQRGNRWLTWFVLRFVLVCV